MGLAEELKDKKIAVNSLWPQTTLATMAVKVFMGDKMYNISRKPEIMADAAFYMITSDSDKYTGNFAIDETLLREHGEQDFSKYLLDPTAKPPQDFYID